MSESARYPALRAISRVYRILAMFAGVGTVLMTLLFVVSLFSSDTYMQVRGWDHLIMMLWGVFATLTLMSVSEGIHLVIDIEANTRAFKDAPQRVEP